MRNDLIAHMREMIARGQFDTPKRLELSARLLIEREGLSVEAKSRKPETPEEGPHEDRGYGSRPSGRG